MIIVSQDKMEIYNFNEIFKLYVDDWFNIRVEKYSDNMIDDFLGKYETEERAKEVLQEIVKQKAIFEFFKNVPERTQILLAEDFKEDNEIFDTYEMPEK